MRNRDLGEDGASRFAWMVAESPGEESRRWAATYLALDSLVDALRFLHDRRFEHGGVSLENLWLRADGTTVMAPWSPLSRTESPMAVSRILSHAFEGVADVQAFASLLPLEDAAYDELRRRCAERREMRPPNGLALLYLLRETEEGRKYAASLGPEVRKEQLQRLAAEWLSSPPFLETLAWHELQRALAGKMSVELHGGWAVARRE